MSAKTERTLRITAETETERRQAWALLGDNALLFGDNGDDPDGDYYLPAEPLTENDHGVRGVIAAGLGEMTEVVFTTSREWLREGHEALPTISDEMFNDWLDADPQGAFEEACKQVEAHAQGYAGYSSADVIVYVPSGDEDYREQDDDPAAVERERFFSSFRERMAAEEAERRAARDNAAPADSPTRTGRDRMFR